MNAKKIFFCLAMALFITCSTELLSEEICIDGVCGNQGVLRSSSSTTYYYYSSSSRATYYYSSSSATYYYSSSSRVSSSSFASSSSRPSSSSVASSSSTGCPDYNSLTHFCDTRDNKTYRYVRIGSLDWMAENLSYVASGSVYRNDTYGRYYSWAAAMGLSSSCTPGAVGCSIATNHRGICPSGWHIANKAEWDALMAYESLWASYGFTALPGGFYDSYEGLYYDTGNIGYWWITHESRARYYQIKEDADYDGEIIYYDSYLNVRCVR